MCCLLIYVPIVELFDRLRRYLWEIQVSYLREKANLMFDEELSVPAKVKEQSHLSEVLERCLLRT